MQTTVSTTEHDLAPPASAGARLLATEPRWTLLVLRLTLGLMILPHGLQKLFGWFGGYGFSGTMGYFTEMLGIPYVLGLLAIVAEVVGGLALLAGLVTRVATFGVGVTMIVAALMVHLPNGFFMNWSGNQAGEGIEFFLLALGIVVALILGGGGRFAVDRRFASRS